MTGRELLLTGWLQVILSVASCLLENVVNGLANSEAFLEIAQRVRRCLFRMRILLLMMVRE